MGFVRLKSDFWIHVKGEGKGAVYLALYADDLVLVGREIQRIKEVKRELNEEFKMKDLGEARFLLGIEIRRQENEDVLLIQEKYANDVVARFGMGNSNRVTTALGLGIKLDSSQHPSTDAEKEEMSKYPYMSGIESAMYLARWTRPDLAEVVSELSKFS